jgi:hypothetical protein
MPEAIASLSLLHFRLAISERSEVFMQQVCAAAALKLTD